MKPVLIDSSSAILLYKADLLEKMTAAYTVCMAPSVIREVCVADRPGGSWFLKALHEGKLKRMLLDGPADYDRRLAGLGAGERDTLIAQGRGQARFIIIDDRKGAQICRFKGIPFINALLCPKILFWGGWIDRSACGDAIEFLLSLGRYSRFVIEYARRCSADDLALFHPVDLFQPSSMRVI